MPFHEASNREFPDIRSTSDSLQAFSSSIAGLLSSRAVLEGIGVGNQSATPTAALLLTILQESAGRLGTILFAHRLGTALEPECKQWRLAADVFNDGAMLLDCLSPALPRTLRVALLSLSSVLRALCGVAAGSAKASLSAHFAKEGNLGELNAKDSSQETVISLFGMLVGSIVVSYAKSPEITWTLLILLLAIHLGTNHAAVRAVQMRTLNRQRACLLLSTLFEDGHCLTPVQVAERESIFDWDGVLRWQGGPTLGWCTIGVSLDELIQMSSLPKESDNMTGEKASAASRFNSLLKLFKDENFLVYSDSWGGHPRRRDSRSVIVLKEAATAMDALKAWAMVLMGIRAQHDRDDAQGKKGNMGEKIIDTGDVLRVARMLLKQLSVRWKDDIILMKARGWDLNIGALETGRLRRLRMIDELESRKSL